MHRFSFVPMSVVVLGCVLTESLVNAAFKDHRSLNVLSDRKAENLDLRPGDSSKYHLTVKGKSYGTDFFSILEVDPAPGRIEYQWIRKTDDGKVIERHQYTVDHNDFFLDSAAIESELSGCKTSLKKVTVPLGTFDVCEVKEYTGIPGQPTRIIGYARIPFGVLYFKYPDTNVVEALVQVSRAQ